MTKLKSQSLRTRNGKRIVSESETDKMNVDVDNRVCLFAICSRQKKHTQSWSVFSHCFFYCFIWIHSSQLYLIDFPRRICALFARFLAAHAKIHLWSYFQLRGQIRWFNSGKKTQDESEKNAIKIDEIDWGWDKWLQQTNMQNNRVECATSGISSLSALIHRRFCCLEETFFPSCYLRSTWYVFNLHWVLNETLK